MERASPSIKRTHRAIVAGVEGLNDIINHIIAQRLRDQDTSTYFQLLFLIISIHL